MRSGDDLASQRLDRLRAMMAKRDVPAILTADPINIAYATNAHNMTIYSMMGAVRFLLVNAAGPTILWEFAGSEHLARDNPNVAEVRPAPGITALSGPNYLDAAASFATEVASACGHRDGVPAHLAVERIDHPVTDAFRTAGLVLADATETFAMTRLIKLPGEIEVMRHAVDRVMTGVENLHHILAPGLTEIEVWAEFQRDLIATGGEFVSTRLVQSGPRTFPYFQEAGPRLLDVGDLFSIDTDAVRLGGYGVDFSRTFVVGDKPATTGQRSLHAMALDQLEHNADLLEPGRSFESFATSAWTVPERLAPYGYYCIAHGLGMSGEYPYVPVQGSEPFPIPGAFEPGMVMCVESYIGDPALGQGVKLEDQFLITETGSERLSTTPFEPALTS